ncbi:MAG: hypothetical protein HY698_19785 [Deltaproteobacteria bacterium]|nr:hypothetical protein [Deltaproteobacteria bacterium]
MNSKNTKSAVSAVAVSMVVVSLAGPVRAAGQGPNAGPPDPRQGERLDGRSPPRNPRRVALAVPRLVLGVPRVGLKLALWPVFRVSETIEQNALHSRLYWALTSEDEKIRVWPVVHYETGFLPSVGLRYYDTRSLGTGSLVDLRARTAGPSLFLAEMRLRPPDATPVPLAVTFQYLHENDALFAGIHGETEEELEAQGRAESRYEVDRVLGRIAHARGLVGPLSLALRGEVDVRDFDNGVERNGDRPIVEVYCTNPGTPSCTEVDERLVPGFRHGVRVVRGGATLRLDTRSVDARYPAGFSVLVDSVYSHGVIGDASQHLILAGDTRLSVRIGDRTLLLSVRGGLVQPLSDASVPFDELLSPTGSLGVRGLKTGRLRGHSALVGLLEYRWLVAPYLDTSVLVDYGGAFDQGFQNFGVDRMIPSVGIGLRVFRHEKTYWQSGRIAALQVAFSEEGFRLLLSASE